MTHLKRTGFVALLAMVAIAASESPLWGQIPAPPAGPAITPPPAAAPGFHPVTEAEAQEALAQVRAAADSLDQRFATAGTSAQGWKDYLGWDKFTAEIKKPKPDTTVVNDTYSKLAAGYEGLELRWFANLRTALEQYVAVSGVVGNAELEKAVRTHADELTKQLQSLGPNPTTEETQKIADNVLWLETARQAPELVRMARGRFSSPNFHSQISGTIIGLAIGGPVDETAPIEDCILGTTIRGMGRTIGETKACLTSDPNCGAFDAVLKAVNHSNNVGHNGPVCIYSTGETCLTAVKHFWIDADGLHANPAVANASTHSTIQDIQSIKGRKMVERIAWRRATKQLPEAEAIAGRHAAARLAPRVDAQADPNVRDANQRYEEKARQPLWERRVFPALLAFATTPANIEPRGIQALPTQLAAPSAPPELARSAEITVRLHESAINNAAEAVFTGMRLTDDMVQRTSVDLLGRMPEQLKPEQNQEPFTIVFPKEQLPRVQPITVSFSDNGFSVTLRGREYYTGDRRQPGMNITATYKFVKTPEGFKAVRQGDMQIYGFGQQPGTRRSVRQEAIWTALQRKFGKVFAPEIKLEGFTPQGRLAKAGKFVPVEIISRNGWLAIGWCRASQANPAVAVGN